MSTARPMPTEHRRRIDRESAAARILTAHYPSADRRICRCGAEWHPLHQAKELERAGVLKDTP
jgi:hypothetical protein